jgi:hypothetical protein
MKTPLKITLAVIALGLLIGTSAQAVMISAGSRLDFGVGTVTYDTTNLATVSQVNSWTNAQVTLASGDFSSVALGSAVTLATPWVFTAATPSLWSVGGFTFDLNAGSLVGPSPRSSTFLNVSGTGTIKSGSFDPTPGVWTFTSTDASGTPQTSFTFTTDTSANPTPDGGTTIILLGLALTGLEGARRILRRR